MQTHIYYPIHRSRWHVPHRCVQVVLAHEQPDGHARYRPPHSVRLLRVTYLVRGTARCCVLPWRVERCRIRSYSACRISVELMLPRRTSSYSCSPGNQIATLPEAHIIISQASCDTMTSESLLPATRNDILRPRDIVKHQIVIIGKGL